MSKKELLIILKNVLYFLCEKQKDEQVGNAESALWCSEQDERSRDPARDH